ncbi:hypothetical protein ACN47E_006146 [Coniothyrium glycines]
MLSLYVCRQCRARLARHPSPLQIPHRQSRATFISLRPKPTASAAKPAADETSKPGRIASSQDESERAQHDSMGWVPSEGGRYSRQLWWHGEGEAQPPGGFVRPDYASAVPEGNLEASRSGPAHLIHNALTQGNIAQAWTIFDKNYTSRECQALNDPLHGELNLLDEGRVFLHLLNSVNSYFCKNSGDIVVTPTILLFRYERLGVARPEYWARQTLNYLSYQIIRASNGTSDRPARDLPSLIFELLSVWRLFFQCKGAGDGNLEAISNTWHLPAIESLPSLFTSNDFGMRLQEYHPKYIGNAYLGFCAAYLYSISEALPVGMIQQQAAPFLQVLERLLAGSRVRPVIIHTRQSTMFKALPEQVQSQIIEEIDASPRKAVSKLGLTDRMPAHDTELGANLETHYLKRIARAVVSKESAGILDALWTEVEETYNDEGVNQTIPPRIYNAFLSGYLTLLSPQKSVDIWNHMIAHGVKPNILSWVALLEGCVKAQDLNAFNEMWQRLLRSGLEPDNYAWTTRVYGLMSLRQINQGLAALDEMGKRWASAESVVQHSQLHVKGHKGSKKLPTTAKAVNRCIKPSTEAMNGAISALVQISGNRLRQDKRIDFVQKILKWAANFEIKPDARTYNSLIKLYLQGGNHSMAFKILRQMEHDGLQADIATYTMLIDVALSGRNLDSMTHKEQSSHVVSIFNDLESSGLQLNNQIYATTIDRLLKNHSNFDAVRALLEHMTSRDVIPSAHVYTSLITHYFQQSPPEIATIDSIANQALTSHRMPSDRVFFDRLIEGYATHGEIIKMKQVLKTLVRHKKTLDWNALTAIIQAFARNGDFEDARRIVQDVQRTEGVAAFGITGGATGESKFFSAVRSLALGIDEDRIGDFLATDRPIVASDDDAGGLSQLRDEETRKTLKNAEAQEEAGAVRDGVRRDDGQMLEYGGVTHDLGYEQRQPEPGSVPDDEDVHGFLTDNVISDFRKTSKR